MNSRPDHTLVGKLLALADGTTEEIVQSALGTGVEETLWVMFGELLPRLARAGLADEEIVIDYRLRLEREDGSYQVRLRPSASLVEVTEEAANVPQLSIDHRPADFADLFRALLGARHELGAAAVAGSVVGDQALTKALTGSFCDSPGLAELAATYGSCKWDEFWNPRYYEPYLAPRRHDRIKLLEIGAGGGPDPHVGGESLRMWRDYFPRALIYGVDLFDKVGIEEQRIRFLQGDQNDEKFLARLAEEVGRPDIIIDDGSHVSQHVITTFRQLFPCLSDGGLYIIEDTSTSYWPAFGGSERERNDPETTLGFLKTLVDGLNHQDFLWPRDYSPSYPDSHVAGIYFHHLFVVVEKGSNSLSSGKDRLAEWGVDLEKPMQILEFYEQ